MELRTVRGIWELNMVLDVLTRCGQIKMATGGLEKFNSDNDRGKE